MIGRRVWRGMQPKQSGVISLRMRMVASFSLALTRVEGVNLLYIKYDHTGDEEFVERAENVTPRTQMPWHPHLLQGQVVIMLTQNVKHGDPIEGLEVRWGLVCNIMNALTALPHLYPHATGNGTMPWRYGGRMDEPMHRWYDPKYGMFDVLDEAKVRRLYAPKKMFEDEIVSPEDALDLGPAVANLPGCDLRTAEEMMAAGLEVRLAAAQAELCGAGRDVVDVDVFREWLILRDLDLAAHLLAWWTALDVACEGEVEGVWKS